MSHISFSKVIDQVVEVIRDGILAGRWKDTIPGRNQLAVELEVSHATTEEAMRRLAKEGLLVTQGPGKRRRIVLTKENFQPRHFGVRILAYEPADRNSLETIDLLEKLNKAGFSAVVASTTLIGLGMDVKRVAKVVKQNPADAWIVNAGSRDILEWFSEQPVSAFAMYGNKSGIPIAGIAVRSDIQRLIRRLVELGHRRIVLLIREEHIKPKPSLFSRNFLEALEGEGIAPSSYNLPAWGFRPEGLHRCLDSLYKTIPPTALIISEFPILIAVRDYLSHRGIISPRDISLICMNPDYSFEWCATLTSHFDFDYTAINRRVVRWVKNVASGKENRKQEVIFSKFIEGGTIGPVPKAGKPV